MKEKNWAFKKKSLGSSIPLVQRIFFLKMSQGPNAPSPKTFEIFSLFLERFGNLNLFIYFGIFIQEQNATNKHMEKKKKCNRHSMDFID